MSFLIDVPQELRRPTNRDSTSTTHNPYADASEGCYLGDAPARAPNNPARITYRTLPAVAPASVLHLRRERVIETWLGSLCTKC